MSDSGTNGRWVRECPKCGHWWKPRSSSKPSGNCPACNSFTNRLVEMVPADELKRERERADKAEMQREATDLVYLETVKQLKAAEHRAEKAEAHVATEAA